MADGDIEAAPSAVGLMLPWEVLAGGFVLIDGFVHPIVNGVIQPAREITATLGAMFMASRLADTPARGQALLALSDQLIQQAMELKSGIQSTPGAEAPSPRRGKHEQPTLKGQQCHRTSSSSHS